MSCEQHLKSWSSGNLVKAYMVSGAAGLACCVFMHDLGSTDAGTPITVEYSLGNPLAIAFLVSALVSASLIAWLFFLGNAQAESLMYGAVAVCIGLLIATSAESAVHSLALVAAVCLAALTPVVYVLRSEFSLESILLFTAPLSLTFVVTIASLSPSGAMGFGIAERLWFGVGYFVNAWMIKMMYNDGHLC